MRLEWSALWLGRGEEWLLGRKEKEKIKNKKQKKYLKSTPPGTCLRNSTPTTPLAKQKCHKSMTVCTAGRSISSCRWGRLGTPKHLLCYLILGWYHDLTLNLTGSTNLKMWVLQGFTNTANPALMKEANQSGHSVFPALCQAQPNWPMTTWGRKNTPVPQRVHKGTCLETEDPKRWCQRNG